MKAAEPAKAADRPFEQVSAYYRPSMSAASQAERASSILVTRSIVEAQVSDPGLLLSLAITRRVHENSSVVFGSIRRGRRARSR